MLAKNSYHKLCRIAHAVRKEMEVLQDDHCLWDEDLCGMCGIASYHLYRDLIKEFNDVKFVLNAYDDIPKPVFDHCYLLVHGYITDITASQFDCRRVEIRRDRCYDIDSDYWFWNKSRRVIIDPDCYDWSTWPSAQSPFNWHEDWSYQRNRELATQNKFD